MWSAPLRRRRHKRLCRSELARSARTYEWRVGAETKMATTAMILWAVLAMELAVKMATAREQINPSLECSCRSSHRAEDRFDLNCQSIGNGEIVGGMNRIRVEESMLSCAPGQHGGAAAGDWVLADVPGWGVYRLSRRALTWKDASEACEAVREQLVALDGGEAEVRALLRAFLPHTPDRKELLWVGIRYFPADKEFYTVRGQKMTQLQWIRNHPVIRENQRCVVVDIASKLHGPHGCNGKRRFFCRG